MVEVVGLIFHIPPGQCAALLENFVILEVPGYLLLVPAPAHDDHAVGSPVIEQNYEVLVRFPHSSSQAREPLRLWKERSVLRLARPVLLAGRENRLRQLLEFGETRGVVSGAPTDVGVQCGRQVCKHLVHLAL